MGGRGGAGARGRCAAATGDNNGKEKRTNDVYRSCGAYGGA